MKTALVHGFLGHTKDWQEMVSLLAAINPATEIQIPDLWQQVSPQKFTTLQSAGEHLSQVITGDELTLVGYSLGGRLLLHWPKNQWVRVKKVILLSVHTGLITSAEKYERRLSDQKWSERFLNEEWTKVFNDWNQQAVFQNDGVRPDREEAQFERASLAAALKNWSLGSQEDLKGVWSGAPFHVHYITGQNDLKFSSHAKALKDFGSPWRFHSIPDAGHSLHLSHAQAVAGLISRA